ncbi:MAG TPA: PEP-CTERM sorting domain-containing protein [Phycisphaerae bacterium]|nr:PEP-CTERM sorting domain-containing protein [Phycisphaerae bacterium]HRY71234.1 PEP-CTERM sorting domain-containing protein [Phycisphaerae bacterium]HSA29620.1 PEP-CTERM sorting domain-containing protein [Phycisphaerae bacterium]
MHKRYGTLVFVAALVSGTLSPTGYAAIIAQDHFDAYTLGSIADQGTIADGWLNTWGGYARTTNPIPVRDVVADVFAPSGNQSLALGYNVGSGTLHNNALTRQFTPQTDTFYVGFLLQTTGMSDSSDLFHLYFNDNNATTSAGTNGTSLALMITEGNRSLRAGGLDESIFAANVDDVVNRIVLRFSKTVSGGDYDQLDVFVDQSTDATPTHTIVNTVPASGPGATVSALHVRMRYTAATDRVNFDDLRVATTFAEVVPEPASLSLLLLGAAGYLRRKRPA